MARASPWLHGNSRETGSLVACGYANIYRQGQPPRPATATHLILLLLPCPLRSGPGGGGGRRLHRRSGLTSVPQRSRLPFAGLSRHRLHHKSQPSGGFAQEKANLNAKSGHFALYKNICWKDMSFLDYALFPYTYKHTHTCFGQCAQRKQYPQLLLACELCIHRT